MATDVVVVVVVVFFFSLGKSTQTQTWLRGLSEQRLDLILCINSQFSAAKPTIHTFDTSAIAPASESDQSPTRRAKVLTLIASPLQGELGAGYTTYQQTGRREDPTKMRTNDSQPDLNSSFGMSRT